jgi:hypothetical protein
MDNLAAPGGSWENACIEALGATGQDEKAQTLRRTAFEERLSSPYLRAYLKKLPDFDDVEAEERAMAHALGFGILELALAFLKNGRTRTGPLNSWSRAPPRSTETRIICSIRRPG